MFCFHETGSQTGFELLISCLYFTRAGITDMNHCTQIFFFFGGKSFAIHHELGSNSWSSCLSLLGTEITGLSHHIQSLIFSQVNIQIELFKLQGSEAWWIVPILFPPGRKRKLYPQLLSVHFSDQATYSRDQENSTPWTWGYTTDNSDFEQKLNMDETLLAHRITRWYKNGRINENTQPLK